VCSDRASFESIAVSGQTSFRIYCLRSSWNVGGVPKFGSVFRLGLEVELDEGVRCQKSSHEEQEAINRSTRFMRSPAGLQRTPSISLNPQRIALNLSVLNKSFYHFFARRFFAVFSIAKSSNFFPSLIAATSHRGRAPLPAHVLPALSRYLGGTFLPLNTDPPRPLLDAISPPNLAS
jgi:hypothetical protein